MPSSHPVTKASTRLSHLVSEQAGSLVEDMGILPVAGKEIRLSVDWSQLTLPVMQAPMFIVSNLDLVIASCRSGVIGAFPSGNPREPESLDSWLTDIRETERDCLDRGERFAPFCVNLL